MTIVELGIVIGVISILIGTVLVAKGHADNAKAQSTATMVRSIQEITPSWSERRRRGRGFAGGGLPLLTNTELQASGMLPKVSTGDAVAGLPGRISRIQTGWGTPMTVRHVPTSIAGGIWYEYEVVFCTPTREAADDLQRMLQGRGVVVRPGIAPAAAPAPADLTTHQCPAGCTGCLMQIQSGGS